MKQKTKWQIAISFIIILLILLNPTHSDFRDFVGAVGESTKEVKTKKTGYFLFFSTFEEIIFESYDNAGFDSQDNYTITTEVTESSKKYVGILKNFFKFSGFDFAFGPSEEKATSERAMLDSIAAAEEAMKAAEEEAMQYAAADSLAAAARVNE